MALFNSRATSRRRYCRMFGVPLSDGRWIRKMTRMTRLRSLGISVVLFSMSNISAPAQTPPGGHLQRLFERTGARHRNARRNL
jgi:hypothetical protein